MTRKERLLSLATLLFTLAALVPVPVRGHHRGCVTSCKINLYNIACAMEMYSTDFAGRYPRNLNKLVPNYLRRIPVCPATERQSYRASFGSGVPSNYPGHKDYYVVECTGTNHRKAGLLADFPKFDGLSGLIEEP